MTARLPPEAFEVYYALGPGRQISQVAERYGVSPIVARTTAVRERWEEQARERDDARRYAARAEIPEYSARVDQEHLDALRDLRARAMQALSEMPFEKMADVIQALKLAIGKEREILGLDVPKSPAVSLTINQLERLPSREEVGATIAELYQLGVQRGLIHQAALPGGDDARPAESA